MGRMGVTDVDDNEMNEEGIANQAATGARNTDTMIMEIQQSKPLPNSHLACTE